MDWIGRVNKPVQLHKTYHQHSTWHGMEEGVLGCRRAGHDGAGRGGGGQAGRGGAGRGGAGRGRAGHLVMKVQQALNELLVQSQGCTDVSVHHSQTQQPQQLPSVIYKLCFGLYALHSCLHLLSTTHHKLLLQVHTN